VSLSFLHSFASSRSFSLAAATLAALAAATPAQSPLAKDRATGAGMVDVAACKEWLGTLAGPEFEGRGTGQPGFEKAANYVAAHFKGLGLEARGENGTYFQHVPWAATKLVMEQTFLKFHKAGQEVAVVPAERLSGRVATKLSANGDAVLLVVAAPPRDGDKDTPAFPGLAELDVKGKVVIVYVRQPEGADGRDLPQQHFDVAKELQGKEAATVIFAQSTKPRAPLQGSRGGGRRANPAAAGASRAPGAITFGGDDLDTFLKAAGMSSDMLPTAPLLTAVPLTASLELAIEETNAPAMNVWAVLPGSDAKLKHEYVVIGSHLDHLGRRGDTISPGADDDGSGTTGVMAVAQMFAKNNVRPARSILFLCFSGEESGLVGSAYFANNCPIPLAAIVAELQMDMIGRDEEENMEGNKGEKAEDNRNTVHLIGTKKLSPALHELCMAKNETARFEIEWDQEGMFSRSDHANFARKGVPIAFFFTGLHRDYHQPSDTPDKIHYEKLLRIATWVYDIGFELAIQDARPAIDPQLWKKFRGSSGNIPEQPAAPLMPAPKDEKKPDDKK
jgi:hypothetical protein